MNLLNALRTEAASVESNIVSLTCLEDPREYEHRRLRELREHLEDLRYSISWLEVRHGIRQL